MSNQGFFVISLDFELYWGMFDKVSLEKYGENIKGVEKAIPEMLSLFSLYGIHATWATVGMLLCQNKEELLQRLPSLEERPHYRDKKMSAYEHITGDSLGADQLNDPYHFGLHLAKRICATQNQELGSHTFSHYYCIDGSENNKAIFAADCRAFAKCVEPLSQKISSIVFPRNQTTKDAIAVCKEFGFTTYRGTPQHVLYTGKSEQKQTNHILRLLRFLDTYVNVSGHHTYTCGTIYQTSQSELANVQGSWFFRPYNKTLSFIEPLKVRRIKKAMTYAAQYNEVFHLWWHPHNFGINRKENLKNLLSILDHFKTLQKEYGMQSCTMSEMAEICSREK